MNQFFTPILAAKRTNSHDPRQFSQTLVFLNQQSDYLLHVLCTDAKYARPLAHDDDKTVSLRPSKLASPGRQLATTMQRQDLSFRKLG